jgi:hypothetical protein
LEDLRYKEIELERAKLDFFKKAEEHRYNEDLKKAKAEFEHQLQYIKQQNEDHIKKLQTEHR